MSGPPGHGSPSGRPVPASPALEEALALHRRGELRAAVERYQRALENLPQLAWAWCQYANALVALARPREAVDAYRKALAIDPSAADVHANCGVAHQMCGDATAALACYDAALALSPTLAAAHANRGAVLRSAGRPRDALAAYERALALDPSHVEAHYNRGIALAELLRLDEAIAAYEQALLLKPAHAEARWNKALALLLTGDYARGWPAYEWRWRHPAFAADMATRHAAVPLWLGKEDIRGKTVLLHAEQGLGDTLQFARYAALVRARGARVVLSVPAALVSLMHTLAGPDEVIAEGETPPACDVRCPLLSLPLACGTTAADIPSARSYLSADLAQVMAWRARLGPRRRFRVGIVWHGGSRHPQDCRRSLALADFLRVLPPGVEAVSLQQEVRESDRPVLEAHGDIAHFGTALRDFADTAALCVNVDLVIAVDTAVAHLAGALGVPVWILLPHAPDWRWLLGRDDSPWYPTARLFRQREAGDWNSALDAARAALTSPRART